MGRTGVYTAPKALAADTVGVGVDSGVGVGVGSMMTATSCMPTIFHLPSLFISVMSYLLPCHVGTVGLTSLRMLEMTVPVMDGTRSTTVQVA